MSTDETQDQDQQQPLEQQLKAFRDDYGDIKNQICRVMPEGTSIAYPSPSRRASGNAADTATKRRVPTHSTSWTWR